MNDILLISLVNTIGAALGSTVKSPKSWKKLEKPLTALRDTLNAFLAAKVE